VRVRFGDCVFDPEMRELWRGDKQVALSPKAFELLALLIAERPRPLPQGRLRDLLWPDSHVGYTSLARVVSEVRQAVGEKARRAAFIRTVPCYGYAFAGAVVVEKPAPAAHDACALVAEDREFLLPDGETFVGRGPECGVRLASSQVSRVHAQFRVNGRRATVRDHGSKNGTWINGSRIEAAAELHDGDEVLFGTYRVVFRSSSLLGSTRTAIPR
jgi:DNA-binding winged helix-turn-helix (wHTH) protein